MTRLSAKQSSIAEDEQMLEAMTIEGDMETKLGLLCSGATRSKNQAVIWPGVEGSSVFEDEYMLDAATRMVFLEGMERLWSLVTWPSSTCKLQTQCNILYRKGH